MSAKCRSEATSEIRINFFANARQPFAGENNGIDIAILYASDGTVWKDYLHTTFTQCRRGCKDFSGTW